MSKRRKKNQRSKSRKKRRIEEERKKSLQTKTNEPECLAENIESKKVSEQKKEVESEALNVKDNIDKEKKGKSDKAESVKETSKSDKTESIKETVKAEKNGLAEETENASILVSNQELGEETYNKIQQTVQLQIDLQPQDAARIKKIFVISGIAAGVLLVVGLATQAYRTNSRYLNAVKMVENAQFSGAITLFEELEAYKDSEDKIKETYYLLAVQYMEEGSFEEAIKLFQELEVYRDCSNELLECKVGQYKQRAEKALEEEKYQEVKELCDKVLNFAPQDKDVLLILEAVEEAENAINLSIAQDYFDEGEIKKAKEICEEMPDFEGVDKLMKAIQDEEVYYDASVAFIAGDFDKAEELYESLKEDDEQVKYDIYNTALHKFGAAVLEEVLKEFPDDAVVTIYAVRVTDENGVLFDVSIVSDGEYTALKGFYEELEFYFDEEADEFYNQYWNTAQKLQLIPIENYLASKKG